MPTSLDQLRAHLWDLVRRVQRDLGKEPADNPQAPFVELFDSMGLVEFLLVLANDLGVPAAAIEQCTQQQYGTVPELAAVLHAREWRRPEKVDPQAAFQAITTTGVGCWLVETACRLPEKTQAAGEINRRLGRPPGWLESHAGIQQRGVWDGQDPLTAATAAGQECLERCGIKNSTVGLMLVTSEAPPLLAGLGAALHQRLGLSSMTPALEVGGASTGFLMALWLGQKMVQFHDVVLILAVG